MRMKWLIMLAVLISCFLRINGAWAETKGYIDSGLNSLTGEAVLGVKYTGTDGSAIYGSSSATDGFYTYGGEFRNSSTTGGGVLGSAYATTGTTFGGQFRNFSTTGYGAYGIVGVIPLNSPGYLQSNSIISSISTTGTGVFGHATARVPGGKGVFGLAEAPTGLTYGGYFESTSTSGTGVYGWASAATGTTRGGRFRSNSTSGIGVHGLASAASGTTNGGYLQSTSTSGRGVFGYASAFSGTNYGGYFLSNSTSGRGVYGWAQGNPGITYGGYFLSSSTSGTGAYGWASAPTGATYGGYFGSSSTSGTGVYGRATATSGTTYGVYGITSSPSGYGVYSKGNMKVEGNQVVTGNQTVIGAKSAVVKLKNGERVTLYAVEASENWFEDFGSSILKQGSALVKIEPTFAETVNTDMDYHVFLTPRGECKGLYVTNQKGTSFEVRELNGGKSDISFSYRIVAKRKGYEDQRLAKVNEDEMPVTATNAGEDMQKDEAIELASHIK